MSKSQGRASTNERYTTKSSNFEIEVRARNNEFFTHFSLSSGNCETIWIFVDRITRPVHFVPYSHHDNFLQDGKTIHTRDLEVSWHTNQYSQSSFSSSSQKVLDSGIGKYDTNQYHGKSYHLEMDGQSKRTIQTLENML